MGTTYSHPVRLLKEHARELEAAITVCLADPKEKAVHKLRSGARRIEAQLALLRKVPDLPPFRAEADELLRELRKLRRAAGAVRDMDVHRTRLEELHAAGHSQSKEAVKLRDEARQLSDELGEQRKRREEKLLQLLKKRQREIASATEALLKALKAADGLAVPPGDLLAIGEKEFERVEKQTPLARHIRRLRKRGAASTADGGGAHGGRAAAAKNEAPRQPRISDDELHTLRKVAKTVRYMAEGADGSRTAKTTAKRFEALQESGGTWHDWLALTEESRDLLGRKHVLTRELKDRTRRHRSSFLEALERRTLEH